MRAQPKLQSLPTKWSIFCLRKEAFLRELGVNPQNRTILVAYSAGVDSSALLFWTACMTQRWQSKVLAVHIHHGIREQSEQEAEFASHTCQELEIECIHKKFSVPTYCQENRLGLEEGARILRYGFLQHLREAYENALVFVGHHLNDLAEDLVMRLNRGTGWPALAGMSAWDEKKGLVRPFLLTPKEELVAFARAVGLTWQEDHTNADTNFLRNRMRHGIVKQMCQENPAFLQQVKNLWLQAEKDRTYWEKILGKIQLQENTSSYFLDKHTLREDAAVRLRMYRKILNALGTGQVQAGNLFILDSLWTEKRTGKTVQFPGHKNATVCKKGIFFERKPEKNF